MSGGALNVEAFVGAVARAFYADPFVVVLDALMHEKFLMEEELPARIKQTTKETSKITRQLEDGRTLFLFCTTTLMLDIIYTFYCHVSKK